MTICLSKANHRRSWVMLTFPSRSWFILETRHPTNNMNRLPFSHVCRPGGISQPSTAAMPVWTLNIASFLHPRHIRAKYRSACGTCRQLAQIRFPPACAHSHSQILTAYTRRCKYWLLQLTQRTGPCGQNFFNWWTFGNQNMWGACQNRGMKRGECGKVLGRM